MDSFLCGALQRFFTSFTRANTHDLLEVVHKDLSVTDLAGAGGTFDRLDDPV
jgi:hypothetical protein